MCDHNARAALVGVLRMEAQWNWVDERRGSEKVATTFSRSFAENGEPRTAR